MSNSAKSILITGPIGRSGEYAEAALQAGWEPVVQELLEVKSFPTNLESECPRKPDWVCVSSKHALHSLENAHEYLKDVPFAVVGEVTAAQVFELGFKVAIEPAKASGVLAFRLKPLLHEGHLVLWPRGSISDDLVRLLRSTGAQLIAPIVYGTGPAALDAPIANTEVLFLASPSTASAYAEALRGAPVRSKIAICIGSTTAGAVREDPRLEFEAVHELKRPREKDLREMLRAIGV